MGGEERTLRGKRMERHDTDTYEDGTVKPTRHCLERGGRREGTGGKWRGECVQVNCTHAWMVTRTTF
jgi:hypothetical protein